MCFCCCILRNCYQPFRGEPQQGFSFPMFLVSIEAKGCFILWSNQRRDRCKPWLSSTQLPLPLKGCGRGNFTGFLSGGKGAVLMGLAQACCSCSRLRCQVQGLCTCPPSPILNWSALSTLFIQPCQAGSVGHSHSVVETLIPYVKCKTIYRQVETKLSPKEMRPYHLNSLIFPWDPSGFCWWQNFCLTQGHPDFVLRVLQF